MKRILLVAMSFFLITTFVSVTSQAQAPAGAAPPISQNLVREGEFAVQLAERLNLGAGMTEAEAEGALSSAGIAPRNGWIADYPVTPDIVGELESAVDAAAESRAFTIGRNEALRAYQSLTAEMGLDMRGDAGQEYTGNEPPPQNYAGYPPEVVPEAVNDYYSQEGPPVVTYYPPPPDFSYMYAWVPYPFWYSGFRFGGYFILHDFHRPIHRHGGHHFVSNHFHDPRTHRLGRIDPATRHFREGFRQDGHARDGSTWGGFRSHEARRGAASIYAQGRNRENGALPGPAQPGGRDFRRAPREARAAVGSNRSILPQSSSRDRSIGRPAIGGSQRERQSRAPAERRLQQRQPEAGGGSSRSYYSGNGAFSSPSLPKGDRSFSPSVRGQASPGSRGRSGAFSGTPQARQSGGSGQGRFFQVR